MLILLPPSEGKTAPVAGPAVDLASLSHPELADARRKVGDALAKVSGQRNALAVLGAGASLAPEVARNTTLWERPAAPAREVYAGVLYDAANAPHWPARADASVLIMSALLGAVSPADRIPPYRLSAGTTLGRLGSTTTFWRPRLSQALNAQAADQLVVDCRSSGYSAMWAAPRDNTVSVRVEREHNGHRAVVSHLAKHWRGLVTAALLALPNQAATADDVAATASGIPGVLGVELKPGILTLVVASA